MLDTIAYSARMATPKQDIGLRRLREVASLQKKAGSNGAGAPLTTLCSHPAATVAPAPLLPADSRAATGDSDGVFFGIAIDKPEYAKK